MQSGVAFEDGVSFEEMALAGYARFYQQLNEVISSNEYEVFSEHHLLFNGVYMRVRSSMVDLIAELLEVFAVEPNVIVELPDPIF